MSGKYCAYCNWIGRWYKCPTKSAHVTGQFPVQTGHQFPNSNMLIAWHIVSICICETKVNCTLMPTYCKCRALPLPIIQLLHIHPLQLLPAAKLNRAIMIQVYFCWQQSVDSRRVFRDVEKWGFTWCGSHRVHSHTPSLTFTWFLTKLFRWSSTWVSWQFHDPTQVFPLAGPLHLVVQTASLTEFNQSNAAVCACKARMKAYFGSIALHIESYKSFLIVLYVWIFFMFIMHFEFSCIF